MRIGRLDRRITIERQPMIDDPVYGPQPAPPDAPWDIVASRIPANRTDDRPGNTESVQNGLRMSNSPARVIIHYRNDIRSDMRVIMHDENDRLYQISSTPAELGRRRWTEFTISEYSS